MDGSSGRAHRYALRLDGATVTIKEACMTETTRS
jgi:hypothetical protein